MNAIALPPTSTLTGASHLKKRSLTLNGHPTSLALEDAFWRALEAWAHDDACALSERVAEIDARRTEGSLASAVRVAVLLRAEARAAGRPLAAPPLHQPEHRSDDDAH